MIDNQQIWENLCKNSKYNLLINIFKGRFKNMLRTDSYFMEDENYKKDANFYCGLLAINGGAYS